MGPGVSCRGPTTENLHVRPGPERRLVPRLVRGQVTARGAASLCCTDKRKEGTGVDERTQEIKCLAGETGGITNV